MAAPDDDAQPAQAPPAPNRAHLIPAARPAPGGRTIRTSPRPTLTAERGSSPPHADSLCDTLRELEEEAAISLPPGAALHRYSRWITPACVKMRFDTHFFVARAPEGAQATPDGDECVGARWLRPRDALDAAAQDELMLVFPTVKHLEQLAEHASVAEALRSAAARRVQPLEPRVIVDGGVAPVLLPGEPGYES